MNCMIVLDTITNDVLYIDLLGKDSLILTVVPILLLQTFKCESGLILSNKVDNKTKHQLMDELVLML